MIELTGDYFDGETSASRPATLTVYERTCRLVCDDLTLEFQLIDASISAPIANLPRRISWGDRGSFETADSADVAALAKLTGESDIEDFANRLEHIWPVALVGLVVVVLVYGAVLFWGVPAASKQVAFMLPDSMLADAAEQSLKAIDKIYTSPSKLSEQRQQELLAYFRSVDHTGKPIEFRSGEGGIGPNAFALIGGYIVVTDELVELAADDREILGVYLHEVGHARGRHAETAILQSTSWLVLLTAITGDVSGVSGAITSLPLLLGQLAFSRELEVEADDYAVNKMLQKQIDPEYLARMLEKLARAEFEDESEESSTEEPLADAQVDSTATEQKSVDEKQLEDERVEERWSEYLSTHPAPANRIARLRAAAREAANAAVQQE